MKQPIDYFMKKNRDDSYKVLIKIFLSNKMKVISRYQKAAEVQEQCFYMNILLHKHSHNLHKCAINRVIFKSINNDII